MNPLLNNSRRITKEYERAAWFEKATGLLHVKTRDCVFRVDINNPDDVLPVDGDPHSAVMEALLDELQAIASRDDAARERDRDKMTEARRQFEKVIADEVKKRTESEARLQEVLLALKKSECRSPSGTVRRYAGRLLKRLKP